MCVVTGGDPTDGIIWRVGGRYSNIVLSVVTMGAHSNKCGMQLSNVGESYMDLCIVTMGDLTN